MGPSKKFLYIFLLFMTGSAKWMFAAEAKSKLVEPVFFNNNNQEDFHQGHNQNHHHLHQPTVSSTLFTSSAYVDETSWLYSGDEDNSNNHYGNNINNNSNFPLYPTNEITLMSGNDSMESTLAPNGTEEEEAYFQSNIPWWRQIIWSILFGAMVIVACAGNVTVIWIVLAHKRMRTVTNYLLVNLSIADAMSSTLNVIPNFSYMLTGNWPFGALYCKIVQFVSMLSICASVFSLMAIAFDRYIAIINPLRPRMGKRLTLGIAVGIWVVGTVLSFPYLLYFVTLIRETKNGGAGDIVCYDEWPDSDPETGHSPQQYVYNLFIMIFTYFVPMFVMGFTYTRVGIELWGSKSIGECTQRQLDNIRSKRRVVKMMIVVVTSFAICWLPTHMYFIWTSLWVEAMREPYIQEVYLGIYWLAMSNSMYNPIIYCWMNNRFRRGFQQVFRWCPFVHYSEVEGTTTYMMHTQRERETTRYSVTGSPELQLTRVSRNGSGSVHIHLHVVSNNDSGRNPSNRSMNMSSSNSPTANLDPKHLCRHNVSSHGGNFSDKLQANTNNPYYSHHRQRSFANNGISTSANTMV